MLIKDKIAALLYQLRKYESAEDTGDDYTGDDIIDSITDVMNIDTPAGHTDIVEPIINTISHIIEELDPNQISDNLDVSDILTMYKAVVAKPDVLLANGIANYLLANIDAMAIYYGDNMDSETVKQISEVCKSANVDESYITVLYYMEIIINDMLSVDPKFNELDTRINSPLFKKFMNLNIITETNHYYSEIIARNLLNVYGITDRIADQVKVYIREAIDPDKYIKSETIGFLL